MAAPLALMLFGAVRSAGASGFSGSQPGDRVATTITLLIAPPGAGFLQPFAPLVFVNPVEGIVVPDGGSVLFTEGATTLAVSPLVRGVSAAGLNGLTSGSHTITATFTGNDQFLGVTSAPATIVVTDIATSTFTLLIPWSTAFSMSDRVVMSAWVLSFGGGAPSFGVQFYVDDNSVPSAQNAVVDGFATVFPPATQFLPGLHAFTAHYLGDGTFAPSVSPPAFVTMYSGSRPASTSVTLGSLAPSTLGQPVTVTARVDVNAPAGSVYFFVDGRVAGYSPVVDVGGNQEASLAVSSLSVGIHVIGAAYTGDATHAPSNALPALQIVSPPATLPNIPQ